MDTRMGGGLYSLGLCGLAAAVALLVRRVVSRLLAARDEIRVSRKRAAALEASELRLHAVLSHQTIIFSPSMRAASIPSPKARVSTPWAVSPDRWSANRFSR
jgi:hypothetical protein